MADHLKALIKVAQWEVDERRRALAALFAEEERWLTALRGLEEEREREQTAAAADPTGAGLHYGGYAKRLIARRDNYANLLRKTRARIEAAQEAVREAFQTLKTYEITRDNHERAARAEAERRETAVLDEMGLNAHRRKEGG